MGEWTASHPGAAAQSRHAEEISSNSAGVAISDSINCRANADSTIRSAHIPPHHVAGLRGREAPQAAGGCDVVEPGLLEPRTVAAVRRRALRGWPAPPRRTTSSTGPAPAAVEPDEPGVVRIAGRDESTRLAHSSHLAERLYRIGYMLQHLMRVHYVEGVAGKIQCVHIRGHEHDVRPALGLRLGTANPQPWSVLFDRGDLSGCDTGGEVDGNGAGAATHIEHRSCPVAVVTVDIRRSFPRCGLDESAAPTRDAHGCTRPVMSLIARPPCDRILFGLEATAGQSILRNSHLIS